MKKLNSSQIREMWLKFFESKQHFIVPSESLIPIDDNSLLFINSGVATLKKYFSGEEKPPAPRMTNSQKAIRTGDIENIGKTARHHTMFEMLGNFSIGDYFKKEAIEFAWELLTSEDFFALEKEKLFITIFEGNDNIPFDQEAYDKWVEMGIDPEHIFKMPAKTNFWDMGQGPCGPSTEIFYDRGEKYNELSATELIKDDVENDRFIEIWNIVFSQYNNDGKGNYTLLPQKNIDTGAGFERIVSVFQQTPTNFETDLFLPIINQIEKETNVKYISDYIPGKLSTEDERTNSSFKAIADFSRTVTFAISDGVVPSNTGRGYVIRRLLRKALIKARALKIEQPFIYKLVDTVVQLMSDFYPNLNKNKDLVIDKIKFEEESFFNTLEKAIKVFENEIVKNDIKDAMPSKLAFVLFETYGLPYEVLEDLVEEKNLTLNKEEFDIEHEKFVELSRANAKETEAMTQQVQNFKDIETTKFLGYELYESKAIVLGIEKNNKEQIIVALDQTPFYATSGGQEFDKGTINGYEVINVTKNNNNVFIHTLNVEEVDFKVGDEVDAQIDIERRQKATRNHSATHLLFSALEKYFGTSLPQVGSKVDDQIFRFDFAYHKKPTEQELVEVQKIVNDWIDNDIACDTTIMSQEEAKKIGATFLDGTKYGKEVRVVKFGDAALDLCGGTHVKSTKQIEKVEVIVLESKGSGIYRIEGVTGNNNISVALEKLNTKVFDQARLEINKKIENVKTLIRIFAAKELLIELENKISEFESNDFVTNVFLFRKSIEEKNSMLKKALIDLISEITNRVSLKLNELKSRNFVLRNEVSDVQVLIEVIVKTLSRKEKPYNVKIETENFVLCGFLEKDSELYDSKFLSEFQQHDRYFRRFAQHPEDKKVKAIIYGYNKSK